MNNQASRNVPDSLHQAAKDQTERTRQRAVAGALAIGNCMNRPCGQRNIIPQPCAATLSCLAFVPPTSEIT
jgi:hypothetical protein